MEQFILKSRIQPKRTINSCLVLIMLYYVYITFILSVAYCILQPLTETYTVYLKFKNKNKKVDRTVAMSYASSNGGYVMFVYRLYTNLSCPHLLKLDMLTNIADIRHAD